MSKIEIPNGITCECPLISIVVGIGTLTGFPSGSIRSAEYEGEVYLRFQTSPIARKSAVASILYFLSLKLLMLLSVSFYPAFTKTDDVGNASVKCQRCPYLNQCTYEILPSGF